MTLVSLTPQAALPSPSTAVWQLGPIPIRAYALCIVLGIVVASLVTDLRLRRRGVAPGAVLDIAVWAVPFGIIGARIYHVVTSPEKYFGADGDLIAAFKIWEGGLGIWGAIAGGAVGAWIAARQLGVPLSVVADAAAPGLPLAQAVGRFGNWFNNELYGGRTSLPWGLEVHRMDPDRAGQALRDPDGTPVLEPGLYHPTFAYEALWNIGVALLVLLLDRRLKLGRGRAFALYVMGYTAGRFWIEIMRTDEATRFFGVRLNVFTAALVFLGALVYFLRARGPRQFLVPVSAQTVEPTRGDVSQVDVSARSGQSRPAAPESYRVVTEDQYQAYLSTGRIPPAPDGVGDADRAATDHAATDHAAAGPAGTAAVDRTATDHAAADPADDTDTADSGPAPSATAASGPGTGRDADPAAGADRPPTTGAQRATTAVGPNGPETADRNR